jgi:hypothetical protein
VKFSEKKLRSEKVLRRALRMIVEADKHGMTMPDVVDRMFPGLDDETCVRASEVLIEALQSGGYIETIGERPTRRRMN